MENNKQQKNEELSLFAESLGHYIKEWQEIGKDPFDFPEELEHDADELVGVAIDPIPCWQKTAEPIDDGLYQTPLGAALVKNNRFVMVNDLVERLPRLGD